MLPRCLSALFPLFSVAWRRLWEVLTAGSSVQPWLQELAEELEDLHDTVDDVLTILHRVMGS